MKKFLLILAIFLLSACSNKEENWENWLHGYNRGYQDGYIKATTDKTINNEFNLNFDWENIYKENHIK